MLPTLVPGQDVLVWCWFNSYKVGDIVVVKVGGKELVKRIQKVRDREYYVVGDNVKASTDSRNFGWINRSQIIGKVIWYSNN